MCETVPCFMYAYKSTQAGVVKHSYRCLCMCRLGQNRVCTVYWWIPWQKYRSFTVYLMLWSTLQTRTHTYTHNKSYKYSLTKSPWLHCIFDAVVNPTNTHTHIHTINNINTPWQNNRGYTVYLMLWSTLQMCSTAIRRHMKEKTLHATRSEAAKQG